MKTMILADHKRLAFLYTPLRTYFSAGSAADAAFGYEISFLFQFDILCFQMFYFFIIMLFPLITKNVDFFFQ